MNENNVKFGTGVKVWLIICIVANVFAFITNAMLGAGLMAIIGVALVGTLTWLLLGKKRMAFYLLIALAADGLIWIPVVM